MAAVDNDSMGERADVEDFELRLHSYPHRVWGTLFVIAADDGEVRWFAQSDEYRMSPTQNLELNPDAPYECRSVPESAVRALRSFLQQVTLPALPSGRTGLGGAMHTLSARDRLTTVRWDWWSALPDAWSELLKVVNYMERPTDDFV
ncbi:MAG TPA: hypothetical protein VFQ61_13695 [Polyangiaceae bacterium]|nr:hypothetical protein [Polyangiaceae bacterium]